MTAIHLLLLQFILILGTHSKRSPQLGIINGQDADINAHPWQVSVQDSGIHFCGGTLISNIWVLSAAHCYAGVSDVSTLSVRAGSSNWQYGGQLVNVARIISHAGYVEGDNDIALLLLEQPVLDKYFVAAELPEQGEEVPVGMSVTVTGWGLTSENGTNFPGVLQSAEIPIIDRSDCQKAYAGQIDVKETMFCAGFMETGGTDTCNGDSGGPAAIDGYVVGIVAFGIGCAQAKYPGIYTQTSEYVDWINQQIDL